MLSDAQPSAAMRKVGGEIGYFPRRMLKTMGPWEVSADDVYAGTETTYLLAKISFVRAAVDKNYQFEISREKGRRSTGLRQFQKEGSSTNFQCYLAPPLHVHSWS